MKTTKNLLYIALAGFVLWIISELLEIFHGGHTPDVYYVTSVHHIFACLGIWGLHMAQARKKEMLSFGTTLLISIGYFAIIYFPIQVMNSGLGVGEFITANPFYKIPFRMIMVGYILFGIAVIKIKYYPAWTGVLMLLGAILYSTAMALKLETMINIDTIIMSLNIIYMSYFGLAKLKSSH